LKPDYVDTPVLAAIRARFESNELCVAGSSAGLLIHALSPLCVHPNTSYNTLRYGVRESKVMENTGTYDIDGGFGFMKYCDISMHYSYRGY